MRSKVARSPKLRFVAVAASMALAIVGFARMGDTPTDLLPEFSPTIVETSLVPTPPAGLFVNFADLQAGALHVQHAHPFAPVSDGRRQFQH